MPERRRKFREKAGPRALQRLLRASSGFKVVARSPVVPVETRAIVFVEYLLR